MEIKDLVFFQRVVKANSISKAAEELFISQSQVSRVISSLEHELGVELFERKGHKLELTPCGKIFYEDSSSIIDLCFKAIDRVKKTYAGMRSQISFASNIEGRTEHFLSEITQSLDSDEVYMCAAPLEGIVRSLKNGVFSFAITVPAVRDSEFHTELLAEDELTLCVYEGHWTSRLDSVSMSDLKDERFVLAMRGYGTREVADSAFSLTGIAPHIAIETWDAKSSLEYVKLGMGITLCRKTIANSPKCNGLKFIPLSDKNLPKTSIGLSWKKDRTLSSDEMRFVEIARKFFVGEGFNYKRQGLPKSATAQQRLIGQDV